MTINPEFAFDEQTHPAASHEHHPSEWNLCALSSPPAAAKREPDETLNHQTRWDDTEPHPGGFYLKAISSLDKWDGITGVVKLGVPHWDAKRLDRKSGMNRDNFSIYMGGKAGNSVVDAGLTWAQTVNKQDHVNPKDFAWRPFWRTDAWHNAPLKPELEWHPGDTVRMSVVLTARDHLRLTISDLGPNPKRVFSQDFDAPGFVAGLPLTLKRVNGIDQKGRESKQEEATRANVTDAVWQDTSLLIDPKRPGINANLTAASSSGANKDAQIILNGIGANSADQLVPFSPEVAKELQYPAGHSKIAATADGEHVDIFGTVPK